MKKVISSVLALITLLFCFVGCDDSKEIVLTDEDIHTDYAGVYLTLTAIDDSDEHIQLKTVWHNETRQEIMYGEYYQIEKYEDSTNTWKSVLATDFAVMDIGLILPAGGKQEKSYSLQYFDVSEKGTYRIRCEFYPGDGEICSTWVSFEVTDKTAETATYSGTMTITPVGHSNITANEVRSDMILDLLNNGEWADSLCDCIHDYTISLNGKVIRYSSGCGTFNNITDGTSFVLSDNDKAAVNEYFESLFEGIDPSEE